jgi:lipopolysaccharide/colanic/teichoic acid biosynthesis glycosyltransferase
MSVIPSPITSQGSNTAGEAGTFVDPALLRKRSAYFFFKRCFDIALSISLLIGLLPLWLLLALLVRLDSRGPILFVNQVVGKNGVGFPLYKFRSMRWLPLSTDEHHDILRNVQQGTPTRTLDGKPVFKTALVDEWRITKVGRWLRSTSLDEVPQLWNVLRGQMSIVGPRPSLPVEVSLYQDWQKQRLLVTPGLTGLYQVTARHRVPIEEMVRIDLEYIRRQSFLLDAEIMLKTPRAMLSGI